MSFESECITFKSLVLKAFNRQFNTNFQPADMTFIPQKVHSSEIARMLAITTTQNDNVRMLINIMPFTFYSDVSRFELMLLPNYPAGTNRDEVYETKVLLRDFEFPELRRYFASQTYKDIIERQPFVYSQTGTMVMTASGFPIKTQTF